MFIAKKQETKSRKDFIVPPVNLKANKQVKPIYNK